MAIDVTMIRKATDSLEAAQKAKKQADANVEAVRGLVGQTGYDITIGGVRLAVAEMDRHYNPKLIRGREMIHLGALKALQGVADHWRDEVVRREAALSEAVR